MCGLLHVNVPALVILSTLYARTLWAAISVYRRGEKIGTVATLFDDAGKLNFVSVTRVGNQFVLVCSRRIPRPWAPFVIMYPTFILPDPMVC